MGWRHRPARTRATTWIPALALAAGAGLWSAARAQVGMQPTMNVDPSGSARVAFFDLYHSDLEFGIRSSSTNAWAVERVDARGGKGEYPSIGDSVEADGSTHDPAVAYYDQVNGDLIYAKRVGGVWSFCLVDSTGDVGSFCSLAFNAASIPTPAISYFDATNGDLKLATWNNTTWSIERVDTTGTVGQYSSLAFDPNNSGRPAIAYYDATNRALKLARRGTSSWTVETVDPSPGVGKFCSLGIDLPIGQGMLSYEISYYDEQNAALKFAGKAGAVWTTTTVDGGSGGPGAVGQYTSLTIDSFHRARIAYYDATNADLKMALNATPNNPASWSAQTVDAAGDVGRSAALALDPQGNPRICSYNVNQGCLRYAAFLGGTWTLENVDAQSRTVRSSSLAFDPQGVARVGFFDAIHGHLMYARRGASGWTYETPDAGYQTGLYVSLALGPGGEPWMSYYDATAGQLRLATRAAGNWSVETVDATGIAGLFSSLVVRNGNPSIAYFDARNEALKFASRVGGVWTLETVDAGPGLGLYSSLALDGSGNPCIAYFDAIHGRLEFATRPAGGGPWSTQIVEASGNVGQYASLAVDPTSGQHLAIGYFDENGLSPRYAESTSGGPWSTEAVDTAGTGGRSTSLVFDNSGTPNIAYYDEPRSSLRYARRSGGWTTPRETADNVGNVGQYASLAFDPAGNPHVSYFDFTAHDLKHATRNSSTGWSRESIDAEFPKLHVWATTGAFVDLTSQYIGTTVCSGLLPAAPDTFQTRARALTVRFLRDRRAEARPDFGGYRLYRVLQSPDTTRMELIRRYSRQRGDFLGWFFSAVDTTDPSLPFKCGSNLAHDSIATFVDPDSNGHYVKVCPQLLNNRCVRDSVFVLQAPAGPHDGIPTYYAVTIEGRNSGLEGTYEELYVPGPNPDTRNNYQLCTTVGDPTTCPRLNLNNKGENVSPTPNQPQLAPTPGPAPNLENILVVPNPYRATEVWDQPGSHEVHFINLPQKATIKIFTVAGDLVVQLQHDNSVRDFEPWNLKNGKGNDVASGIYIYRVESPKCDTCVPPVAVPFHFQSRMIVIR